MIQHRKADVTSASLRGVFRRGTLVVPGEVGWMIQHRKADVTGTSPQLCGPEKQVPPIVWIAGSGSTAMDRRGAIWADGKAVKAKAFTKKRR